MSFPSSCRIHPTAVLSGDIRLGDNVEIGPFAVLDGTITVGPDCVIRPGAYLFGNVTLGRANTVCTGAILGERPQHLKYNDEPTRVEIGDCNIFREGVTVHRGTTHSMRTVIGNHNFFMVNSHVAHDCVIGDRCILTNGSLLGGHCVLEDSVIISGNAAVHQFCRVGRLAMLGGCSASTKDIPPFIMQQYIDTAYGVNLVGMRRAGMTHDQINAVKQAFRIIYRQGLTLPAAEAKLQRDLGHVDVIQEMLNFLRGCTKGISPRRSRYKDEAA
jgi:UDP-N-acetylglucosamine acyltransferase